MRWFPKTRKRRVLVVVVALLLLVLVSVPLWVDGVARAAVVSAAAGSLGVETTLDGLTLRLFEGSCSLHGLSVQNPPGFKQRPFLELDEAVLRLDTGSFFSDRIEATSLVLDGIALHLERGLAGTNYGTILDNTKRKTRQEEAEPGEGGKTFVLRTILIKNVAVRYDFAVAGVRPGVPFVIDRIEMTDVGAKGGGATLSELFPQILREILRSVATLGTQHLPGAALDGVRKIGEKLGGLIPKGD